MPAQRRSRSVFGDENLGDVLGAHPGPARDPCPQGEQKVRRIHGRVEHESIEIVLSAVAQDSALRCVAFVAHLFKGQQADSLEQACLFLTAEKVSFVAQSRRFGRARQIEQVFLYPVERQF